MRTTLRMLARRPGFSVLATLTLALGIAATTVVFTFAYGVLLSPLPYSNTSRLMLLWEFDRTARSDPGSAMGPVTTVPPQDLLAWQQQTRTMESLDALTFGFFSITQGASPTEVIGGRVTPGFFRTIGVQPLIGRAFAPGDPDDVVVLGYDLWQTQYGGDRAIVGRQILLGDGRYTVLGVLPPQFFFYMREFALWAPLSLRPGGRRPRPVMGVGLLRPGVTEPEAQAEFDAIASRLESQSPATNRNRGARVTSVREQYSRFYRPMLGVLLASVGFLLLIACANVASLLLARATERDREMAIRAALGATRWQMVRQLLAESFALAVFAGVTGVAAALFLVPLARTLLPMRLPIPLPGVDRIAISTPVLLFSSAVSVVNGTVVRAGSGAAFRDGGLRRAEHHSGSDTAALSGCRRGGRTGAGGALTDRCGTGHAQRVFSVSRNRFSRRPHSHVSHAHGWIAATAAGAFLPGCDSAGCAFCRGCARRRRHTVCRAEGAMDGARCSPKTAARIRRMPNRPWSTR